jgi:hypothetical protein
VKLTD